MKKHLAFVCLAYMSLGFGIGLKFSDSNPWVNHTWASGVFGITVILFVIAVSVSMPKIQKIISDNEGK